MPFLPTNDSFGSIAPEPLNLNGSAPINDILSPGATGSCYVDNKGHLTPILNNISLMGFEPAARQVTGLVVHAGRPIWITLISNYIFHYIYFSFEVYSSPYILNL